eukprot:jgi/Psemu1/45499/gm1.45499_g
MVRSYTQPSTGPPTAIQAHQTLPLPPDNNPQEVRMDSANMANAMGKHNNRMEGDAERAWTVVVPVVVGARVAGAKHNNSKRTPPGTSIRWVEAPEASKEEEDDNNDVDDENGLGSSPRPLKPTLTNLIASNK